MIKYDFVIIGAGIVGLATGIKLLELNPKLKIVILEKEKYLGVHQTGNNSGVIHSGIYYKPGSLKAENCRRGYDLLIQFLREHEVVHDICGKIIVAVDDEEVNKLHQIFDRGHKNGLKNLKMLNANEMREIEPNVRGKKAILVPQSGIVDFREVLEEFTNLLEKFDSHVIYDTVIEDIKENSDSVTVCDGDKSYSAKYAIICAGLQSDRLAKKNNEDIEFRIIPFRGEYYKLKDESKSLIKNLIYPVPDPSFPFLGVHFTRKINGEIEAGPNAVLSFAREGYGKYDFNFKDTIDTFSWRGFQKVALKYWKTGFGEFYRSYNKSAFTKALKRLVPSVEIGDLEVGGAGIRAQACDKAGNLIDDFYFKKSNRVLHVCNAPSPAATASLAIGETISKHFIN